MLYLGSWNRSKTQRNRKSVPEVKKIVKTGIFGPRHSRLREVTVLLLLLWLVVRHYYVPVKYRPCDFTGYGENRF